MKSEIQSIIQSLKETLYGKPWFGKPVYTLLEEVHPALVYKRPMETGHSRIELLYHMITWTLFTLRRIEHSKDMDARMVDELDWRLIDPLEHTWMHGIDEFKKINNSIVEQLEGKDDQFLKEPVEFRDHNFRTLLNGLIHHHIYHAGQIVYVNKLLQPE